MREEIKDSTVNYSSDVRCDVQCDVAQCDVLRYNAAS
jgi:hypothetical protein